MSNRSDDIRAKMGFARTKLLALRQELAEAQPTDAEVAFVGQKVGEILAACRECFDYAARDLADAHLSTPPGKRTYFPFNSKALADGALQKLSIDSPATYETLRDLVDKIENNQRIQTTGIRLGLVADVNRLVNEKKHDKITRTRKQEDASTRVDFGKGASVTVTEYTWDENGIDYSSASAPPMVGNRPDIGIRLVSEYRLIENEREVAECCSQVIELSWRLLDEIYTSTSLPNAGTFDPKMSLRTPEEVARDELFGRASHIVSRLINVEFVDDGKIVKSISLDFDGNDSFGNDDDAFLAEQCKCAFMRHIKPRFYAREFARFLRDKLAEFEPSGFKPMKWTLPLVQSATVKLPSGSELSYDSFNWNVGIKFQQPEPPRPPPFDLRFEAGACVRLLFPGK